MPCNCSGTALPVVQRCLLTPKQLHRHATWRSISLRLAHAWQAPTYLAGYKSCLVYRSCRLSARAACRLTTITFRTPQTASIPSTGEVFCYLLLHGQSGRLCVRLGREADKESLDRAAVPRPCTAPPRSWAVFGPLRAFVLVPMRCTLPCHPFHYKVA